ncbi:MAG: hypothetical protein JWN18_94 [Parcubacteria group bacterium]|nr:hypothetical protein [Parcubacteria group bacterium]
MPTLIHTLDENPQDKKMLHDLYCSGFLEGECYAFAIALNDGLDWPLVGLMKGDVVWHAGVWAPDGLIYDARGPLSKDAFARHFLLHPYDIRDVTTHELYATRPIDERSIKKARRLAEVLWPDLPWIDSAVAKVKAFADELEALSRKHGLWVCGNVPANTPILFAGYGDEGGYEVRPNSLGLNYSINRYLPS